MTIDLSIEYDRSREDGMRGDFEKLTVLFSQGNHQTIFGIFFRIPCFLLGIPGKSSILGLLLLGVLIAASPVMAQDADPKQDDPPVDPLAPHRTALLAADTDAAGRGGAAAALIAAGDIDWIGAQVFASATPAPATAALLGKLVPFARTGEPPELKARCAAVLDGFMADAIARGRLVESLIALHAAGAAKAADRELLLGIIDVLGRALDTRGIDILIALLESGDEAIRKEALSALRVITCRDFGSDAAAWKAYWNENRHLTRDRLLESGRIKELENAVSEKDDRILQLVKELLDLSPIKAFEFLPSSNLEVKRYAAGFLLDNANAANPEITSRLNLVVEHLGKGEKDKETLKKLLELLGKANGDAAGSGLAERLIPFLRDPDAAVVIVAAGSLSALDKKKALKPENYPPIAEGAQSRLAGLTPPDPANDQLKSRLIGLLEECGQAGATVDSALLQSFAEPGHSAAVRASAIQALGATGEPGVLDYLENILKNDPDGGTRFEAANALKLLGKSGKIDQQRLIAALAGGLKDLQNNVRSVSVAGLGTFKCPEVSGILLEHLKEESDGRVCVNIIDILGDFKNLEGLNAVVNAFSIIKGRKLNGTIVKDCRAATEGAVRKICAENKEHFFTAGESFYGARCFALAAESYEEYLVAARPGNGEDARINVAKGKVALAYYHSSNLEKALPLIEDLETKQAAEPPQRQRTKLLAEGNLALGKHPEAAKWFDIYIGLIPEAEAENRLLAQSSAWVAHFGAGNFERALGLATILKDREPGNNQFLYRFAISLVRMNRTEEGEKEFQRLLNGRLGEDDKNLEWLVRYELSSILIARKSYTEAQAMIGLSTDPLPEGLSDDVRTRVTGRRQQVEVEIAKAKEATPPDADKKTEPEKKSGEDKPPVGDKPSDPGKDPDKALSSTVRPDTTQRSQVHP